MNVHAAALAESYPFDEPTSAFAGDVIGDLSLFPKRLSPKYFYDAAGSELFEQITVLPEYYPTRTELGILRSRGDEIVSIIPKGAALVEFGAGATTKVRLLLERCDFGAYVPVDISGDFLNAQAGALRKDFPELGVYPVAADFTAPFALPAEIEGMPKVGFFPGSTLGNFEPHEARAFLQSARDILGEGAQMIIGVDLEKNERVLYDAYNDAAGVTARFNLNVLVRINRELGGNFDVSAFMHRSVYNRERHRIEMHLIAKKAQTVRILGRNFSFRPGESIHTESSYKYSLDRFTALARDSGWSVRGILDRPRPDVFGSRAGGVRLRLGRELCSSRRCRSGRCGSGLDQSPAIRSHPACRSNPGRYGYPVIGQSVCTQQPRVNNPPLVLSARLEVQ